MILFAKRHGGKAYVINPPQYPTRPKKASPHPGVTQVQQATYVDDNAVFAPTKEDNLETMQADMVMQAVINVRSQGLKSILILTEATIDQLDKLIEPWWIGTKEPTPEPNMKISPRPGRDWDGPRESHQVTMTYKPNNFKDYKWKPPSPQESPIKTWSQPTKKWGISAKLKYLPDETAELKIETSAHAFADPEETIKRIEGDGEEIKEFCTPLNLIKTTKSAQRHHSDCSRHESHAKPLHFHRKRRNHNIQPSYTPKNNT
jgi:hypothetical protein